MTKKQLTRLLYIRLFVCMGVFILMNLATALWNSLEPALMGATLKAQAANDVASYALGRAAQTSNWPLLWLVPGALFIFLLAGFTVRDIVRFLYSKENVL